MTTQKLPAASIAGIVLCVVSVVAFFVLINLGFSREIFGIAGGVAWLGLLIALKPLVEPRSTSAFWFGLAVLAFFIFFVDQTYEYEGRVRLFPLLIGYLGVILSVLDLLSLTDSKVGGFVTRSFGKAFDPANLEGRSTFKEVLVIGAMCLIVLSILLFGFLVSTLLVVIAWMLLAGRKPLPLTLATAAGSFVFVWFLFEFVLRYELYRGLIWELIKG